jgi:hypothetical protein
MAVVYRAEQLSLGREVAFKVLAPALAQDAAYRERFRREGRHAATLDHPNVVAVYDSGEADGQLFIAMRLVRGETLAQRLRSAGVDANETLAVLGPVAAGLDAAHAAGLVHRDVKPANILIDRQGQPFLADFGVAKGPQTTAPSATAGFVGSPTYAAPEQLLGQPVTPAIDIYSLTAVCYECLTGELPYPVEAGLHAKLFDPPPSVAPDLPGASGFNRIVARGMAKAPDARPASAGELVSGLRELTASLPIARSTARPVFTASRLATGSTEGTSDRQLTTTAAQAEPSQPPAVDSSRPTAAVKSADLPAKPPARSRRAAIVIVALAALLVAAGVTGALVTEGHQPRAPTFAASATPFTIRYQRPWHVSQTAVSESIALAGGGIRRSDAADGPPASAPSPHRPIELTSNHATVAAGQLKRSSPVPGGVPPVFARRFGRHTTSTVTRIDGHPARRYTWELDPGWLVLYVLPTDESDAAIICRTQAALTTCGRIVDRTSVGAASALLPLGPDVRLGHAVEAVLRASSKQRLSLHGLGGTPLLNRALPATLTAHDDLRAAVELSRIAAPVRYRMALEMLVDALNREAVAFGTLATAAKSGAFQTYDTAVRHGDAAASRVAFAAKRLQPFRLGVPRLGTIRLPVAPPPTIQSPPSTVTQPSSPPPTPTQPISPPPTRTQPSSPPPRTRTQPSKPTTTTPYA